jgi:hypothetical protein
MNMNSSAGYFIDSDENGFGQCLVLTGSWRNEFSNLMISKGLTVLRLSSSVGWIDEDISFLSNLSFLEGVEVYSWAVRDVTPIFRNTRLRYVGIQSKFNSTAEFQALKNLEVCKLYWRPKISGLESCANLRHLNIVDYPDSDLTRFASLSQLARLQISSRTLFSLEGIGSMSGLKVLDIANCPRLTDIAALASCSTVESVTLDSCKQMSEIPSRLCLDNLQEFFIVDCGKIKTLKPLASCKNLSTLKFTGDTYIVDGDLDFLAKHPAVRDVWYANKSHYSLTREALNARLHSRILQ